jgi:hypothetical protein
MESILTSNPTSGALYNFCYGITTGQPIQRIEPNRGLFISYDNQPISTGITVCFFRPNGATFTHQFRLSRAGGVFSTNFFLECEVYGVGVMGSGVTCAALA